MWHDIPNDIVQSFIGRPMKVQKRDVDMEVVYKPVRCPVKDCKEQYTSAAEFRAHCSEEGLDLAKVDVALESELIDARPSDIIFDTLLRFNSQLRDNPLRDIRKGNDSYRTGEVWRRTSLAIERNGLVRLKDEDYKWLLALLERKLPLSKEDKDAGKEVQDAGMYLWGGNASNVQKALIALDERKPEIEDADDAPVSTNGVAREGVGVHA